MTTHARMYSSKTECLRYVRSDGGRGNKTYQHNTEDVTASDFTTVLTFLTRLILTKNDHAHVFV